MSQKIMEKKKRRKKKEGKKWRSTNGIVKRYEKQMTDGQTESGRT